MRTSIITRALSTGILLLATQIPLAAQQPEPSDTLPRYDLEAVVVSVTRAPLTGTRATRKVEVIGRADLDRTIGDQLTDVLRKNTTVDVIQFPGLLSGVSIRGFRPQFSGINPRTLILVDGRPAGSSNLSTLDATAIERVEVLRGPASALYGSSAMGGVVNVVTRRSGGPVRGRATLTRGSFDSYRGDFEAGGRLTGSLDFDLSLSTFSQRSGYRTGSGRMLGGTEVVKRLDDGGEQRLPEMLRDTLLDFSEQEYRSGSLRLGYDLAPGLRLNGRVEGFVADGVQNPGDLHASYDSRSIKDLDRRSGELGVTGEAGAHSWMLRAYRASESVAYYDRPERDSFVNFRTPTTWSGLQLQDAVVVGTQTVVIGVDHTVARAESERFTASGVGGAPYSPNSTISSSAAFAEGHLSLVDERLTATLGGRLDRVGFEVHRTPLLESHAANRESHTVFNPSAGLRYNHPAGLHLRASAGRAFVTPDAFNVAGYSEMRAGERAVHVTRGNPELRPESSVTWDLGAGMARPRAGIRTELTYFHTEVRDRITTRGAAGAGVTPGGDTIRSLITYENVDRAEIRGVEGSVTYQVGGLERIGIRLFGSGARILRAEQITPDGARAPILNVSALTLNAGVELDDLRRLSGRLSGRYVGERRDADFTDWANPGTVTLPDFLVLDLASDLRLGDRYRLGARVENLTDENYYEVRGYPLPGRTLRLQLGLMF